MSSNNAHVFQHLVCSSASLQVTTSLVKVLVLLVVVYTTTKLHNCLRYCLLACLLACLFCGLVACWPVSYLDQILLSSQSRLQKTADMKGNSTRPSHAVHPLSDCNSQPHHVTTTCCNAAA